jgi:NAD(P)-dependent dehydrogenase (short-subunit alcohol dehydrogenase family)
VSEQQQALKQTLQGKVAVVAGATRGAGRAMAIALGSAGAIVYCTGRTTAAQKSDMNRSETIDETAELVTSAGGQGIAVRVDHTQEAEVKGLFERIAQEQNGQLDILINDIWGGDQLSEWETPFWELVLDKGFQMLERGLHSHIITSRYGVPLMVKRGQGLIIEITDGDQPNYRGNLFYDLVKSSINRIAYGMAEELKGKDLTRITALALTPGFLRSEAMLDHFGVTVDTWRDAIAKDPYFAGSETPYYIGQAVLALATDPNVHSKAGQAWSTWTLVEEYDFKDVDGTQPHWGNFFKAMRAKENAAEG